MKLGDDPELIDRDAFGGNRGDEFTEETQHATFQLGVFQNPAQDDVVPDPMMNTATKIKQEVEGDIVSQVSADKSDADETDPSNESTDDEQSSLALAESYSVLPDHVSPSEHAAEREEYHSLDNPFVRVKVEEPEEIDEQFSESNSENEAMADECVTDHALENEEMNRNSPDDGQKNIIQLIELLQYRVGLSEAPQVFETIDEIARRTESITPSIIREFPLGDAIRSARKKFDGEYPELKMKCKALSSKLKRIHEKEAKNEMR